VINPFDDLPRCADAELFTDLLSREGVRIERIVSKMTSGFCLSPVRQVYG
jgi:hypothetical protein